MILLCLAGGVFITAQLLDLMLMGGKNASYKRARKNFYGGTTCQDLGESVDVVFTNKQQFYNLLTKLKNQGLVKKKIADRGIIWKITSAGLRKLKIAKKQRANYETAPDNKLKIIAFDVPEKERLNRAWLREVLRLLGFKMLQKSLWAGKNKIPEEFLMDLKRKKMFGYLHIFEVSNTGTLKETL